MDPRVWQQHYDDGVPHELPFARTTLVDFLRRSAERYPDRKALIFQNRSLTYAELADHVARLAGALAGLGAGPGSRIAVHAPNLPQLVIGFYATISLEGIAVPTNPIYTAPEIEHQWRDAECEFAILMDYLYAQRIHPIRERLPVRHYVVGSIPEYLRFPLNVLAPLKLRRARPPLMAPIDEGPTVHRFAALIRQAAPAPSVAIDLEHTATLLYTGGTTGVSKGAELTHGNLSSNVQQLLAWVPDVEPGNEVFLAALPLFHSFGFTVAMNTAIALGATLVLIPDPRDIRGIVRAIARHRVTLFPGVPNHFNAIGQLPGVERLDLSSVKYCNSGAAPLPVDVLERFEKLTGATITEGYGLSETTPVTHSNPLKSRKVGSIGVPVPGTLARIVDAETGTRELGPNEVGELVIKGPQVMRGYWKRPDETAAQLRDGWLWTGDLARVDEDGYCFIEGRKKDMILCSGFNPDEIDRVLSAHPAILEAATIGVPDPKRGETVKSFIVLKPGASATADEIVAYCRENLAAYKVPRAIEFLDSLPKSSVLKVLRRELRELEERR
jgi:long-chain acyl-CoA synthetase